MRHFYFRFIRRLGLASSHKKIIGHMEFDFVTSRKFEKNNLRILDIGAHTGEVLNTLKDSNHRHKYHVVAIEPLEANLKKLRLKGKLFKFFGYGSVDVIPYAIGENGVTEFFLGDESTLFTSSKAWMQKFPDNFKAFKSYDVESRDFIELRSEFPQIDLDHFDIVKIDTEGNDSRTLIKLRDGGIRFDAIVIEFELSSIAEISQILKRSFSCSEIYAFVRNGIHTLYIGSLEHEEYLNKMLLANPSLSENIVAFADTPEGR